MSASEAASPMTLPTDTGSPLQGEHLIGARLLEPLHLPTGSHHPSGPESPGHLNRHLARIARGSEDENTLSWYNRGPKSQREPRRHGRVHSCGDLRIVHVLGQRDATAPVGDDLLSHRAKGRIMTTK